MEIVVRATIVFFFMFLVLRALGKRELSEMAPFELVLLLTMGDLVQQGVTQEDMSLTGAMLAAGTIGAWVLFLSYVSYRSAGSRRVLEGVPVLLVRGGAVVGEALKLERLTVEEVAENARGQGIEDLSEVELGVLEPDGKFSFIQREGADRGEGRGPDDGKHKA